MTDFKRFNGCRVCLGHDENQELTQINDRIAIDLFLISSVKIVQINQKDFICKKCHTELDNAIKLRNMCKESDKFLREYSCHAEQDAMFKSLLENSTKIDEHFEKDIFIDEKLKNHQQMKIQHPGIE